MKSEILHIAKDNSETGAPTSQVESLGTWKTKTGNSVLNVNKRVYHFPFIVAHGSNNLLQLSQMGKEFEK